MLIFKITPTSISKMHAYCTLQKYFRSCFFFTGATQKDHEESASRESMTEYTNKETSVLCVCRSLVIPASPLTVLQVLMLPGFHSPEAESALSGDRTSAAL